MKSRCVAVVLAAWFAVAATAGPALAAEPVVVVGTDKVEFGPTASETYLAWFVVNPRNGHANVWAEAIGSDASSRVNPAGTSAYTGGIEGSTLIYQLAQGNDSDLAMVDLASGTALDVPEGLNTDAYEYSPSMSGSSILFGRDNDVVLYDGTTQTDIFTKADTARRGFSVLPIQVNGNYAVWMVTAFRLKDGAPVNGDVYLYDIAAGTTTKFPHPKGTVLYGPSISADGTAYYGQSGNGCGADAVIEEVPLGGTPATIFTFGRGRDFGYSWAVDNTDGTTDLYFDRSRCRGSLNGDIVMLADV